MALFFFNLMLHGDDSSTAGPAKFGVAAGRISHWRLEIPEELTSAAAASKHRRPSTMPSDFSSMVPSSKLTRGSTVSSGGAPLTPINTITGAGADSMADHFVTLFADDDLDVLRPYSSSIGSEGLRPQLVRCAPFPSLAPYFRELKYRV
ncbi:hypothetical protein DFJ58DRAFT_733127 [Suillus subalutaceus]|uniref:uncharacterized protein n=1 Tax=Suillus subalutaceus TaxID=48586 RepID=UPI001B8641DF|nr:uncharacterized protein DFJ58DRAFT_733127 [Suillus subalutaceus]KAG1839911.1 hypothetical protein DFJ58DRAFT_733127 [Suillus subalutaceus]